MMPESIDQTNMPSVDGALHGSGLNSEASIGG